MAEENTQFCSNCKHDIPEANFTTHEIHCRRNIALCEVCQEPFPHAELVLHKEMDHAEEQCKCGLKIEKRFMEVHQRSECSHRLVPCQFCDLEVASFQAKEHEDYCGTRTEPCPVCKCNVMLREQHIHPALCGSLTPPQERHSSRAGVLDQETELGNNNNSLLWSLGQLPDYESSSLDYMLALSLQSEGDLEDPRQEGVWTDVWDRRLGRTPAHSNLTSQLSSNTNNNCTATSPKTNLTAAHSPSSNIMLPCEFCEELFPEEDLILHQTGCSPASAIASFSKQAPSLQYEEIITQGASHVISPRTPSPPTLPLSVSPLSYSSSSSPVEGDVLIPCEFCGVALEEDVLFHHQDKCDLRPQTAYSFDGLSPRKPHHTAKEAPERRSPERQRRVRHQADPDKELLQEMAQGWQKGPSSLDQWPSSAYSYTKNTNAEQQAKSRNQRPPHRGRLEGRRSDKNTETPKVPKNHNVEKEEE
ncbi:TRAF-type zinc finger domain-containing 1 isoform X1 [Labeo rohita]|uniref:TRAF-type zinc finger domain-containing protein 1 n=1 Tax=Labeo rohita TaxID=84645 RepID=A0A498NKR7_LABRO|nr:TRAF-type zinc finger domain-containing 1 isoform X1 [Labeo rohita]